MPSTSPVATAIYMGPTETGVQLDLVCELSVDLLGMLHQGRLDLALVTRQPNSSGGSCIRMEQLVWVGAKNSDAHRRSPLPLALFPPGFCIFRENALLALKSAGIPWRVACTSRSLSGIRAAVSAGLAVSVVAEHTLSQDMRILDRDAGLPTLPGIEIALHTSGVHMPGPAEHLAEFLQDTL